MPNPRGVRNPLSRSRSQSRSPLVSPNEEFQDPLSRPAGSVAFVPFELGPASGVSNDTRRAVRVQAAKASAAARKRTIARRLAERNNLTIEVAGPATSPDDERGRSLSATSPPSTNLLQLPASPSPGPSKRSASAGQLDPFKSYPTKRWHPMIPALVDNFLRLFAPDNSPDLFGREALRTQLWPLALENTSLFHAILLTVASHASISGALNVPMNLLAQLKHSAIESVNEAVTGPGTKGNISDSVVGAIALLGGWELEYGDPATYDTHMRGLETIVSLRCGLFGLQPTQTSTQSFSPPIVHLVLQVGNEMALCTGKHPSFGQAQSPATPFSPDADLSLGFMTLRNQHLLIPSLLHGVDVLNSIDIESSNALAELEHTKYTLAQWECSNNVRGIYRPHLTLLEDTMKRQANTHIQLAGLSICEYMLITAGSTILEPPEYLQLEISQLQTEVLVGTVYEEVGFWALFTICTVTGKCGPRHMRSLKRMQLEQELETWAVCRMLLEKYVYPAFILDDRAYALWEAVYASSIAGNAEPTLSEPTRFKKGIVHPTTYLSQQIDAEVG